MKLLCESVNLSDYLQETEEIDFDHLVIREQTALWAHRSLPELDLVKEIFEFVRDKIAHSRDIQSPRITRKASEVLVFKEGICYAKSNLLAALLRSFGIPAGFCYQRLTIGDEPETGYCIHALNAVYLSSLQKWIRLDSRGNKEGVNAQFSTEEEKLAFPVREQYDEVDYPTIYVNPNPKTMQCLKDNTDGLDMYFHHLPTEI
ncbi:transglutaminase family protein [Paenibacillus sp. J2TS4]|uniref:transglutaminase-like domain-containing protein n=1 Tax=Paenibacillus sp. J2TS4 TaxID=2807194 RepID=UPI001B1F3DE0|nr:transglutaminase family protein [Paenibacillus sp. J2TS4]GIP34027.1 hypothetical protein J2TS4_32370 [Paenibacillus sp. J2TS4]